MKHIPINCEDCQHHSIYEETIGDFGEKMIVENLCDLLPKGENISREEPKGIGDNCPLTNKEKIMKILLKIILCSIIAIIVPLIFWSYITFLIKVMIFISDWL